MCKRCDLSLLGRSKGYNEDGDFTFPKTTGKKRKLDESMKVEGTQEGDGTPDTQESGEEKKKKKKKKLDAVEVCIGEGVELGRGVLGGGGAGKVCIGEGVELGRCVLGRGWSWEGVYWRGGGAGKVCIGEGVELGR